MTMVASTTEEEPKRLPDTQLCPCCGGKMDAIDKAEGRIELRCQGCGMSEVRIL